MIISNKSNNKDKDTKDVKLGGKGISDKDSKDVEIGGSNGKGKSAKSAKSEGGESDKVSESKVKNKKVNSNLVPKSKVSSESKISGQHFVLQVLDGRGLVSFVPESRLSIYGCFVISRDLVTDPSAKAILILSINDDYTASVAFDSNVVDINVGQELYYSTVINSHSTPISTQLLGRVVSGDLKPLDGKPLTIQPAAYVGRQTLQSTNSSKRPLSRIIETGIKSIDLITPIAAGSLFGLVGGAGTGKTVFKLELMNKILKNNRKAIIIFSGVGERTREGVELVENMSKSKILKRSIVMLSFMSDSPVSRRQCLINSVNYAQGFRLMGYDVILFIDNTYRYVQSNNELFAEFGVIQDGYHSTVVDDMWVHDVCGDYSETANYPAGTITVIQAIYAPDDNQDDKSVQLNSEHCKGMIFLDRAKAGRGEYPSMDPLRSVSKTIMLRSYSDRLKVENMIRTIFIYESEYKIRVETLGAESLMPEQADLVKKAQLYTNYLTQPFESAGRYSGNVSSGGSLTFRDMIKDIDYLNTYHHQISDPHEVRMKDTPINVLN